MLCRWSPLYFAVAGGGGHEARVLKPRARVLHAVAPLLIAPVYPVMNIPAGRDRMVFMYRSLFLAAISLFPVLASGR